ncbi:hypothetical protein THIOKS11950014 [Thiocapsa sp. KS1]|nr:hypothetical protein THIOKS11950014 [Thiocapsa sp. KS1]
MVLKIAFVAGLSDKKLRQKLQPLQALSIVEHIDLYRRQPYADHKIRWQKLPHWAVRGRVVGELMRFALLLFRARRYDLIVACHQEYHGVMAWLAGKINRRPVVQMIIGEVDWIWGNPIFRRAVSAASGCAVRGGISVDRLKHYGYQGPVAVIGNPYSGPPATQAQRTPESIRYDLICVAAIVDAKAHCWLLNEVAAVKTELPAIRLALAGVGNLESIVRQQVERLGLTDNVSFLGWLDEPQLQDAYRSSRALILSSWHEGLPMCVVEAMSLGLPVIVTRVGELPWLVEDGVSGIMVEYNDTGALAEAILALSRDPETAHRMGAAGQRRIADLLVEWRVSAISQSWQTLLSSACANASRGHAGRS